MADRSLGGLEPRGRGGVPSQGTTATRSTSPAPSETAAAPRQGTIPEGALLGIPLTGTSWSRPESGRQRDPLLIPRNFHPRAEPEKGSAVMDPGRAMPTNFPGAFFARCRRNRRGKSVVSKAELGGIMNLLEEDGGILVRCDRPHRGGRRSTGRLSAARGSTPSWSGPGGISTGRPGELGVRRADLSPTRSDPAAPVQAGLLARPAGRRRIRLMTDRVAEALMTCLERVCGSGAAEINVLGCSELSARRGDLRRPGSTHSRIPPTGRSTA